MKIFPDLQALQREVGREIAVSPWLHIDQNRINRFADATDDQQWIHTDPQRAAQGPFGTTVAHGFLTLSLLPALLESAIAVEAQKMGRSMTTVRNVFIRSPSIGAVATNRSASPKPCYDITFKRPASLGVHGESAGLVRMTIMLLINGPAPDVRPKLSHSLR